MDEIGWLSINEYSRTSGQSISTIRRRIKHGSLPFKMVEGKYFIEAPLSNMCTHMSSSEEELLKLRLENHRSKGRVLELESEIMELKMLIDVLENKLMTPKLPKLPMNVT